MRDQGVNRADIESNIENLTLTVEMMETLRYQILLLRPWSVIA